MIKTLIYSLNEMPVKEWYPYCMLCLGHPHCHFCRTICKWETIRNKIQRLAYIDCVVETCFKIYFEKIIYKLILS